MTDRNEALRLADELDAEVVRTVQLDVTHTKAAALLRQQAERIAELEVTQAGIMQAITDPENQPSQYGTVTIDYLSDKLKEWERRWAKRDEQADKANAERDQLRAEVERLRVDAERYQWLRVNAYVELKCDSPKEKGWAPETLDAALDHARTTHKDEG